MPHQKLKLSDLLTSLTAAWDSSPFWTQAEAIAYLNHALRWWNLLTGYWKAEAVVAVPFVTSYISLPGTLVFGAEVYSQATLKPLRQTSLWELDQAHSQWEAETVSSRGKVPTTTKLWAPVGLNTIAAWPRDPGANLVVNGLAATPVLSNPADWVDIGELESVNIVYFALHIGAFKRGAASVQTTRRFFQTFLDAARNYNSRLIFSSVFRKSLGLDQQKSLAPMIDTRPAQPTGPAPGNG
jgi:hypothetical protein